MFGFGRKNRDYKATIRNTGQSFDVKGGINLLQAALKAGIEWPYDCRSGTCGSCRAKRLGGKVKALCDFAPALGRDRMKEGYILACQARLKSDVEVEVDFEQGVINPEYKS